MAAKASTDLAQLPDARRLIDPPFWFPKVVPCRLRAETLLIEMEFRGGRVLYGRPAHREVPEVQDLDGDVPQWPPQLQRAS